MSLNYTPRGAFILLALMVSVGSGCKEEGQVASVPAGTDLEVALQTPLSTKTATEGQKFVATTTQPVVVEGKTVIESGTKVLGTVSNVKTPGTIKGGAALTLDFDELILANGDSREIEAEPIVMVGKADTKSDVERVVGTTAAGAIVGAIVNGGKGAIIGGAIGAGAGGVWAVTTRGDQIVLEPGQKFRVEISESTEVPLRAGL